MPACALWRKDRYLHLSGLDQAMFSGTAADGNDDDDGNEDDDMLGVRTREK